MVSLPSSFVLLSGGGCDTKPVFDRVGQSAFFKALMVPDIKTRFQSDPSTTCGVFFLPRDMPVLTGFSGLHTPRHHPRLFTAPDAKQTNLYLTGTMCLLHGNDLLYVYHLSYGFPSLTGCDGRNNRPNVTTCVRMSREPQAKLTVWTTNNKDTPCAS